MKGAPFFLAAVFVLVAVLGVVLVAVLGVGAVLILVILRVILVLILVLIVHCKILQFSSAVCPPQ